MQPETITATEMHKRRGAILRRCSRDGEHFIVEKDGIPLVAIVPIADYRQYTQATVKRADKPDASRCRTA
jgi:antitoxin (DNA-binding transcriptional repressor) of toxin-antitoxin stability system